jgi:virginiamycin B lyase
MGRLFPDFSSLCKPRKFLAVGEALLRRDNEFTKALKFGVLILVLFLLACPFGIQANFKSKVSAAAATPVRDPPSFDFVQNFTIPIPNSGPNAIVSGPNGTLWFVEFSAGRIGEFVTSNNSFHEFAIPETGAIPACLAIDQFGTVWFSDQKNGSAAIWSLDPASGKFTRYPIPNTKSLPLFIVVDNEHNVWFTESAGGKIGELSYPSYSMTEFSVPVSQFEPLEMTLDQNHSLLWISLAQPSSFAGMIASFNMTAKKFSLLYQPPFSLEEPVGIVRDKQGDIWVSEHRGSSITELIPTNSTWRKYVTSLPPASFQLPFSAPATLAMDNSGRLWFVEHFSNRVGVLDPSTGVIQEFAIPGPPGPFAYSVLNTMDAQGNFWFTNFGANSIEMFSMNATTAIATNVNGPNQEPTIQAGQSASVDLTVKNLGNTTQTLALNATSSFSVDGDTPPSEVSFNVTGDSLSLGSGQSAEIKVNVSPDISLASGSYSISVIFSDGNSSTIQSFFITVNSSSLYFFYHIGDYTDYILVGAIVVVAAVYLSIRRSSVKRDTPRLKVGN